MTDGYDEWAAARTPSLLRFAHVLAGPIEGAGEAAENVVDRLVRRALARVWTSWESIVRGDDPDLRARRSVVEACPSRRSAPVATRVPVPAGGASYDGPADALGSWLGGLPVRRRAAVVLRHLEGRSDDEIAEVVGASVSAVRKDLERATASLPDDLPLDESLLALADSAPVRLRAAVGPVDPPPPARLRSPWMAAVAVVVLVASVAFVNHATRTPPGVVHYPSGSVPAAWRYESYGGVQVQVPATWGWGGAPIHSEVFGGSGLGGCGADQAAVRSPDDHSSYITSLTPFTGRPVKMSDQCVAWGSDGTMPRTDAVWFASPLPVGEKLLGAVVAETRIVAGQHVTAFSRDPQLRRQILGTAQQVDVDANGCPTQPVLTSVAGAGSAVPESLSVCVYSQDTGSSVLLWSAHQGSAAALAYTRAFASATAHGSSCAATPQGEWVALGIRDGRGGAERWDLLDPRCSRLVGHGSESTLTVGDVAPWAGGGTTAYVDPPQQVDPRVAAYFRGATG